MKPNGERGEESKANLDFLIETLAKPEQRIASLLYPSADDKQQNDATIGALVATCQNLFKEIEELGNVHHATGNKQRGKDHQTSSASLSGLDQLFIPDASTLDVETLWGQVDLQNEQLIKVMKKSVKRLVASKDHIKLLDLDLVVSDDDAAVSDSDDESDRESGSDNSDNDGDDGNEANESSERIAAPRKADEDSDGDDDNDDDDDEEVDDETRKIRERMARAMEDMEAESDGEDDDDDAAAFGNSKSKQSEKDKEEEDAYDSMREEMRDGFFDLHEMEDFADEEEDFLPEDIYGQSEEEVNQKMAFGEQKSFHQRQREGIDNEGSDDDDDDNDEMEEEFEEFKPTKRKKYRAKEEIDALFTLYETTRKDFGDDDDDDNEDDAIINMTAADFFGRPNKKVVDRYDKMHPNKNQQQSKQRGGKHGDDDDDDSWGAYDFDKEDEAEGWGMNTSAVDAMDEEQGDDGDQDGDEEQESSDDDDDDNDNDEGDDDSEMDQNKHRNTDHAKRARNLDAQTKEMEQDMLAEKPWQMTGEAKGTSRPVNSLLEGTPEFQFALKMAPTITIQHTESLEEIIKKRILAEDWDDVVPRELPDVGWHKKRGELPEVSQEKSKLGLGELYEREYLKKAMGFDKDAAEKDTKEDKAKNEMKALFASLCSKLDALSNYHFAPRPVANEAEVRAVNTPAIAMEEVLPLHVSDARGVAPEEVYGAKRGREGVLRGDTEMDQTERKRLRSAKKAARRKARKEKQADERLISRLQPGLGLNNPYEKRKAREELAIARSRGRVVAGEEDTNAKYGSSGTFFKRLQQEAQDTIQGGRADESQAKEKKSKAKSSAFKL